MNNQTKASEGCFGSYADVTISDIDEQKDAVTWNVHLLVFSIYEDRKDKFWFDTAFIGFEELNKDPVTVIDARSVVSLEHVYQPDDSSFLSENEEQWRARAEREGVARAEAVEI